MMRTWRRVSHSSPAGAPFKPGVGLSGDVQTPQNSCHPDGADHREGMICAVRPHITQPCGGVLRSFSSRETSSFCPSALIRNHNFSASSEGYVVLRFLGEFTARIQESTNPNAMRFSRVCLISAPLKEKPSFVDHLITFDLTPDIFSYSWHHRGKHVPSETFSVYHSSSPLHRAERDVRPGLY